MLGNPASGEAICRNRPIAIRMDIEPTYRFPFFGALPKAAQRAHIRLFNWSGRRHHLDYFEENFIWRSNREYLQAFQGTKIYFMPTLETIAIVKNKELALAP